MCLRSVAGFEEEDENENEDETRRRMFLRTKGIPRWTSHLRE